MNSKKFGINYGTYLGLLLICLALLTYFFGIDDKESVIPSLLNNCIIIIFLSYSIIFFRDNYQNGFISYSHALKLGTTIAFFSSVILSFYTFLFISYINPEAINEIIKYTEQSILESNNEISEEELNMMLEMTGRFTQPHWIMIMGTLGGTFMGFFYSLIISIFVKKNDLN